MELVAISLRTILIYFFVYVAIRVMGKREIGKLSIFDLVISILIAELAVVVIENIDKSVWHGLLPMILLVAFQVVFAYLSMKNQTLRKWFEGGPSYLIRNGQLNRDEMHKQRYTLDDLLMQLRENKVNNIADVEFALLEPTGKLTVTTKEQFHKSPSQSLNSPVTIRYEGLPIPLIMDGEIQEENVLRIGKTMFWLKKELKKYEIADFKDVFLCTIDHLGYIYIDKK
jgi:uncharacterized membrane protein YcaP (DUF421 family)